MVRAWEGRMREDVGTGSSGVSIPPRVVGGKKAFGEVQISDATRNRGGRAHPRLQMPLVKSKQTPAVLGRGG